MLYPRRPQNCFKQVLGLLLSLVFLTSGFVLPGDFRNQRPNKAVLRNRRNMPANRRRKTLLLISLLILISAGMATASGSMLNAALASGRDGMIANVNLGNAGASSSSSNPERLRNYARNVADGGDSICCCRFSIEVTWTLFFVVPWTAVLIVWTES